MASQVDIKELMNVVVVKNRVCDGKVRQNFDGREFLWEPGGTKTMPRAHAEWFVAKSMYLMLPGDINEGTPASSHYKLVIVGDGQDESDITRETLSNVKELLDTKNMPQLTRVDPKTGEPMRRVYIDPRSTGAMAGAVARERQEEAVVERVSKAIIKQGANDIADAVEQTGADEAEIETAVKKISGRVEARA